MIIKIAFITISIIILRLIMNIVRYNQTIKFLNMYLNWLSNTTWDLVEHKQTIIDLWEKANVSDSFVPRASPIGMGQGISYKKHMFFSFPTNETDLVNATVSAFYEAKGVYKRRIISSINPLDWISFIVFLPRELLKYFKIESQNIIVKIIQVFWWFFGALSTVILSVYPEELKALINNFLNK